MIGGGPTCNACDTTRVLPKTTIEQIPICAHPMWDPKEERGLCLLDQPRATREIEREQSIRPTRASRLSNLLEVLCPSAESAYRRARKGLYQMSRAAQGSLGGDDLQRLMHARHERLQQTSRQASNSLTKLNETKKTSSLRIPAWSPTAVLT